MQDEELACFHVFIEVDNDPPTCLDCGIPMKKIEEGNWIPLDEQET